MGWIGESYQRRQQQVHIALSLGQPATPHASGRENIIIEQKRNGSNPALVEDRWVSLLRPLRWKYLCDSDFFIT